MYNENLYRANVRFIGDNYEDVEPLMELHETANPDIDLLDMVDEELIRLSGSELIVYKFYRGDDYDSLYEENSKKIIDIKGILVHGHYEPSLLEEGVTEFGVELTNDQIFTFNKSYLEGSLGRILIPGDIIKPRFQNQRYEVFEVQEDRFDAYGVFHIIASAKLLRDGPDVQIDII